MSANPAELDAMIQSPEGISLHFRTASVSERLVAFILDLLLLTVIITILGFLVAWTLGGGAVMILTFFARQFYFAWCEVRWNGTTPAKRWLHLRVIRADGGPLTTEVVLARNFTREIELFIPLVILFSPEQMLAGQTGVVALVASVWVVLLLLFPLTNVERRRLGDLLAGTRVVVSPPVAMLPDMADQRNRTISHAGSSESEPPRFTTAQLGIYGVHELEVLEDVLRKAAAQGGRETAAAVRDSIVRRIDWKGDATAWPASTYLRAFYTAQRKHLEHLLLAGKRRASAKPRAAASRRPPKSEH